MFEDCNYAPTTDNPTYLKFKELQKALKESEDDLFTTTNPLELELPVRICDNIYVCECVSLSRRLSNNLLIEWKPSSREIPDTASDDPIFASVTHLLLIAPTQSVDLPASTSLSTTSSNPNSKARIEILELPITDIRLESLLVHLRSACDFIKKAAENRGTILIHCLLETRTAQVVCAYRKCYLYPG
jgi:hypothetical protein